MVQNIGDRVALGAALDRNNTGLHEARRSSERGQLSGLGFVNEGLDHNPIAYDRLFEMAWRDETVDRPLRAASLRPSANRCTTRMGNAAGNSLLGAFAREPARPPSRASATLRLTSHTSSSAREKTC